MTYKSTHYKLLDPFLKIAQTFPDVNDKRAEKNQQWIYTTHPLDWTQEFPKLVVEATNITPHWFSGGQEDEETYTYVVFYDVVFTYYVKRMKEYTCPDNIKRKGKGLIEYMVINKFFPLFNKNRIQILKDNCWIDFITPKGIGNIVPALDDFAWKCDFTFNVTAKINTSVPFSGEDVIETINMGESVEY
jgi:hypothetical protein